MASASVPSDVTNVIQFPQMARLVRKPAYVRPPRQQGKRELPVLGLAMVIHVAEQRAISCIVGKVSTETTDGLPCWFFAVPVVLTDGERIDEQLGMPVPCMFHYSPTPGTIMVQGTPIQFALTHTPRGPTYKPLSLRGAFIRIEWGALQGINWYTHLTRPALDPELALDLEL